MTDATSVDTLLIEIQVTAALARAFQAAEDAMRLHPGFVVRIGLDERMRGHRALPSIKCEVGTEDMCRFASLLATMTTSEMRQLLDRAVRSFKADNSPSAEPEDDEF